MYYIAVFFVTQSCCPADCCGNLDGEDCSGFGGIACNTTIKLMCNYLLFVNCNCPSYRVFLSRHMAMIVVSSWLWWVRVMTYKVMWHMIVFFFFLFLIVIFNCSFKLRIISLLSQFLGVILSSLINTGPGKYKFIKFCSRYRSSDLYITIHWMICSIFHGSNTIQGQCLAHVQQYNTI